METDELLAVLPVAVVLVFTGVLVVVSARRLAKRRVEMAAFAAGHGLSWQRVSRMPASLDGIAWLGSGFQWGMFAGLGRRVTNLMEGAHGGLDVAIFDYAVTASSGVAMPTSRTTRYTVVCLRERGGGPWKVYEEGGFGYLPVGELGDFLKSALKQFHAQEHAA